MTTRTNQAVFGLPWLSNLFPPLLAATSTSCSTRHQCNIKANLFITASAKVFDVFFFALVHYILHKVRFLRSSHFKFHHDCSFKVGSSRCAIASEGGEALFRYLLSATVPTYIIGLLSFNFYGYLLVLYYSAYSFWAMYVHTGVNTYHALHHGKKTAPKLWLVLHH